jgi:predicted amino acid-binding ACT domain protein
VGPSLRQRLVALSGEDKPGIMHAVSSFFADKGINILSMNVYNGIHQYE